MCEALRSRLATKKGLGALFACGAPSWRRSVTLHWKPRGPPAAEPARKCASAFCEALRSRLARKKGAGCAVPLRSPFGAGYGACSEASGTSRCRACSEGAAQALSPPAHNILVTSLGGRFVYRPPQKKQKKRGTTDWPGIWRGRAIFPDPWPVCGPPRLFFVFCLCCFVFFVFLFFLIFYFLFFCSSFFWGGVRLFFLEGFWCFVVFLMFFISLFYFWVYR